MYVSPSWGFGLVGILSLLSLRMMTYSNSCCVKTFAHSVVVNDWTNEIRYCPPEHETSTKQRANSFYFFIYYYFFNLSKKDMFSSLSFLISTPTIHTLAPGSGLGWLYGVQSWPMFRTLTREAPNKEIDFSWLVLCTSVTPLSLSPPSLTKKSSQWSCSL